MSIIISPGSKIDTAPAGKGKLRLRGNEGTLGFFVSSVGRDYDEGPEYLVSNAHVLANPAFNPVVGDRVFALGDGGPQEIAKVKAWAPINLGNAVLMADVAVAKLNDGVNYTPLVAGYDFPICGISNHIAPELMIYTYGAETRKNSKRIKLVNPRMIVPIQTGGPDGPIFQLANLVSCEDYGQPGDSGGPILNRWGRLLGMHVGERAGADGENNTSYFVPIVKALTAIRAALRKEVKVWAQQNSSVDLANNGMRKNER